MIVAFDSITQNTVTADEVANDNINEPFRYECLCCGEEVHIAAARSRKKAPHFRHLRGNSDKDCELYLGRLLQSGTGIESAIVAAQKRARSHAEIIFDLKEQLFYFSVSFSEEKIDELQDGEYELEISNGPEKLIKPVLINKSNFAPDSPVRFPLNLSSNSFHITMRSRRSAGKMITSYYDILKRIQFPTFFKLQSADNDISIAKRHTDGIIYTDTRYCAIASKKSYLEKLIPYSPNICIGTIKEIPALGKTIFCAEITIPSTSPELQDTMKSFGYHLKKAERITLLWPPTYLVDGAHHCKPGKIYLSASFELKPRSNITCNSDQITNKGELYTIDFLDSIRIKQDSVALQITPDNTDTPILNKEIKTETAAIVEVGTDKAFYSVDKDGYRLLYPGRYYLTSGMKILQCSGNYIEKIYTSPEIRKPTAVKRLMNIRKYYKATNPFSEDMLFGVNLSKVAKIYIEECRNTGLINIKALDYIKAGLI